MHSTGITTANPKTQQQNWKCNDKSQNTTRKSKNGLSTRIVTNWMPFYKHKPYWQWTFGYFSRLFWCWTYKVICKILSTFQCIKVSLCKLKSRLRVAVCMEYFLSFKKVDAMRHCVHSLSGDPCRQPVSKCSSTINVGVFFNLFLWFPFCRCVQHFRATIDHGPFVNKLEWHTFWTHVLNKQLGDIDCSTTKTWTQQHSLCQWTLYSYNQHSWIKRLFTFVKYLSSEYDNTNTQIQYKYTLV